MKKTLFVIIQLLSFVLFLSIGFSFSVSMPATIPISTTVLNYNLSLNSSCSVQNIVFNHVGSGFNLSVYCFSGSVLQSNTLPVGSGLPRFNIIIDDSLSDSVAHVQ